MKMIPNDYFKQIDNEEKAYILGFMAADGHIAPPYRFRLTLAEEDKEILIKIKNAMKCGNITYVKKYPICFDGKTYNCQNQWRYSINSKNLVDDLYKFGVVGTKTYSVRIPKLIPINLLPHFVRGYFDGDGCISVSGKYKNYYRINICVNKQFGKQLIKLLNDNNIKSILGKEERNIHKIRIDSAYEVGKFCKWLYTDAMIYLDRKYKKYLDLAKTKYINQKIKSSKYIGIHKRKNKWIATGQSNKKQIYIGIFDTELQAYKAKIKYQLTQI